MEIEHWDVKSHVKASRNNCPWFYRDFELDWAQLDCLYVETGPINHLNGLDVISMTLPPSVLFRIPFILYLLVLVPAASLFIAAFLGAARLLKTRLLCPSFGCRRLQLVSLTCPLVRGWRRTPAHTAKIASKILMSRLSIVLRP